MPEYGMVLPWCCAAGRHPLKVGHHILVLAKLLPSGCLLGAEDSCVIFRLQPGLIKVALNALGGFVPIFVGAQIPLLVLQFLRHLFTEGVSAEGTEYLNAVPIFGHEIRIPNHVGVIAL